MGFLTECLMEMVPVATGYRLTGADLVDCESLDNTVVARDVKPLQLQLVGTARLLAVQLTSRLGIV